MAGKYILIADADQKTVVKLEEVLADLDVQVSAAADGAHALERALSVRQDLFLLADRLPIIDTPKLVQILRNNPRTAAVPIVLLRTHEGSTPYADGALQKPLQRQAVIDAVLKHAFKLGVVVEAGEKLAGSLDEIPIADLLQVVRANRREGVLEIQADSTQGHIWVRRGEVIDARAGKSEGLKALFRLLALRVGRFSFKPSRVTRAPLIEMSLEGLLFEAARQADEVARLSAERPLPARLLPLKDLSALPEGLHPVHRELLLLAEFYGDVESIIENAHVTDLEAHLGLRSLIDAGLLGPAAGLPGGRTEDLRLEPALIVHVKHWARHSSRRPRPVRVAVFVSAAETISGIYALLPGARWSQHQDRVLGNRITYALDGDLVLQLDFYPPGKVFLPLLEIPVGLLVGGLVIAGESDDKELDDLNESVALLRASGLPAEFLSYGAQLSGDWMRRAFDIAADLEVYRIERQQMRAVADALRALLLRYAVATGWQLQAITK